MPGYESLMKGDIAAKRSMIKEVSRMSRSCRSVAKLAIVLPASSRRLPFPAKMMQNFYYSLYYPNPETGETFACDAIIANPPSFAAPHLAEAFGLPLMLSFSECPDLKRGYRCTADHLASDGMVAYGAMAASARQHQAIQRIAAAL